MPSQNHISSVNKGVGDAESLKALILSAKQGNTLAFEELYTTLYTPVYRYALSKSHDVELTEDICQQTFLKFYEALASYTPEKSPLAYLFTIAKHLLINHGEKHSFTPVDESFFETHDSGADDSIDEAHTQHLASRIDTYLPSLTVDEREVIQLYFYAELEYKEIAETLAKEEATVRKIKERALKKLRILTQHLNEGN